jgi:hypothetical protein
VVIYASRVDDIVAVAVALDTDEERYFLTWGRIQDTVDPAPLAALVLEHSTGCTLGGKPVRARVCHTLQEAAKETYFYECLFSMAQRPIPFGDGYAAWREERGRLMAEGRELWYLGRPMEGRDGN